MPKRIQVAIVDDHQSIIDGYKYRLQGAEGIEVVATTYYGEEIEPLLAARDVDVLLLDAHIPTSPMNPAPFPIMILLPDILEKYPQLHVLIISMHNKRAFIKYALEAGASGYVIKDDRETIESLEAVVRSVAGGGIHFSRQALRPLLRQRSGQQELTQRQLQALSLCVAYPNETTAELAQRLNVAHSTMRNLLSGAYLRLRVRSRAAAVAEAQRQGLILTQVATLTIDQC